MAKVFNQKIKILYLMQMMWMETDADHVLNMQQILSKLEEKDIRAERKSIYDDFEVLRQFGLDIRFRKSQPSGYYLAERALSEADVTYLIKLLMLEEKKQILSDSSSDETDFSNKLIQKLKGQLSIHQSNIQITPDQLPAVEQEPVEIPKEVLPSAAHEDEKKEIQILFKGKHMEAVLAYGGFIEEPKEHKSGLYKVRMNTVVDEKFYGWMVSQGFGIKIVKPKAEAEAYRAHLKKLFKQYK